MRLILLFLLLFGFQASLAQDGSEDMPEDVEIELEDEEEMEEDEDDEPRTPPPPTSRFRKASNRFGGSKRSSKRGGRTGGGEDRLGKTEGKIKFELADPPKYYKRKNRPYLMPNGN